MLCLDHLTVIAPSLSEGVEHVRSCLDIDVPFGTKHPKMGTHNHRLRLGDRTYMEIIAVDPNAASPSGPRWFGLGRTEAVRSDWTHGARLRAWVARTDDIDKALAAHEEHFGGRLHFGPLDHDEFSLLSDGSLPMDGLLPSVIDRAGRKSPVDQMEDLGARLRDFVLEHPSPGEITALYESLGIRGAPRVVEGPKPRYFATIDTPRGVRTLH